MGVHISAPLGRHPGGAEDLFQRVGAHPVVERHAARRAAGSDVAGLPAQPAGGHRQHACISVQRADHAQVHLVSRHLVPGAALCIAITGIAVRANGTVGGQPGGVDCELVQRTHGGVSEGGVDQRRADAAAAHQRRGRHGRGRQRGPGKCGGVYGPHGAPGRRAAA